MKNDRVKKHSHMGKRKMCYLVALLMAGVISLIGLTGCDTYKLHEDGYFIFSENKERSEVALLTELGEQQETLIVPSTHNGLVVEQIGAPSRSLSVYTWSSKNLENLYLPYNINRIYSRGLGGCVALKQLILCSYTPVNMLNDAFAHLSILKVYVPAEAYIGYMELYGEQGSLDPVMGKYIVKANVSFLFNYENSPNSNYYWIDNVEKGEKIVEPQAPERNGYRFTGWYRDSDCTEKWSFEQAVDSESVMLYAGWTA